MRIASIGQLTVSQIIEDRLKQKIEANGEECSSNNWHHPMHLRLCRPSIPKERDRKPCAAVKSELHAYFGFQLVALSTKGRSIDFEIPPAHKGECEKASDE
jgi:hypothetical protein